MRWHKHAAAGSYLAARNGGLLSRGMLRREEGLALGPVRLIGTIANNNTTATAMWFSTA